MRLDADYPFLSSFLQFWTRPAAETKDFRAGRRYISSFSLNHNSFPRLHIQHFRNFLFSDNCINLLFSFPRIASCCHCLWCLIIEVSTDITYRIGTNSNQVPLIYRAIRLYEALCIGQVLSTCDVHCTHGVYLCHSAWKVYMTYEIWSYREIFSLLSGHFYNPIFRRLSNLGTYNLKDWLLSTLTFIFAYALPYAIRTYFKPWVPLGDQSKLAGALVTLPRCGWFLAMLYGRHLGFRNFTR